MSKRDEQIARMKGLMTYGMVTESKRTPVKDSIEGPDGKVYAIIREGAKYYIKSTNKGNELVTESFDYIGGFMNKKNNEFSSYNQASKNLELKVRSLNEAYGVKKSVEIHNPERKESLMVEMTDAMKASLARYRQIMNNAAGIMNESAAISASNTGVPEAPKTSAFSPKLGEPFTNTAEAKLDSDLKTTANDPEKQGEPFGDNKKAEECKDAQYVPDGSVANQKPSGGKVVRVNENEEYVETIEECDEWGSCGLPASAGIGEVGDDAPFTETLHEDEDMIEDEPIGFADDDMSIDEGEEEEDIDLDNLDLDLEVDEPTEDPELDDMDTEESLDDEEELEDEPEVEGLDSEDDEIASLRAQVEELTNLVHQLMGDEDEYELEFDNEMDDEGFDVDDEDKDMDFDMDDDAEFDDENEDLDDELQVESRQYVQRLVEDMVDLIGGFRDAQRAGNDLQPNNPNFREDEAFATDGKGKSQPWGLVKKAILDFGKTNPEDTKLQLKCGKMCSALRNIYTCMRNIDYTIKNDLPQFVNTRACNPQELSVDDANQIYDICDDVLQEIVEVMMREYNKLVNFINQNNIDCMDEFSRLGVETYADKVSKLEILADNIYKANGLGNDEVDIDDEDMDDDMEEPTAPQTPARDLDKENDDAAYAAAKNFDDSMFESRRARRINEEGTRLNVFGKHPGYRKKPMNLPATGEDKNQWGEDWNDESVYSEQPFGQKVGDSAPFDDVVKATVDSLVENLKKKI